MNCPICLNSEITTYQHLNVGKCSSCYHIWQLDLKTTINYDKEYVDVRYNSYDTIGIMSHLRAGFTIALEILLHKNKNEKKVLCDVGYGNGDYIKLMEKYGYEAYGIDVNQHDYGVKRIDYNTNLKFDFVTFYDTLEHIPDPSVARKLNTQLYIITIPNRPKSIDMYANWKHYRPGEHLHYFSKKSLEICLNASILIEQSLEDIIRSNSKNFEGEFGSDNVTTFVLSPNK